jgi:hypothetical protein
MELSWHQQRAAGMHRMPDDIVGYSYRAANYCPNCTLRVLHSSPTGEPPIAGMSIELHLDVLARMRGIDRDDESSYNSGEFPKVLFRDMADDDTCESCGCTWGA